MGLRQRNPVVSSPGHWLIPALLAAAAVALQAGGEAFREALQFDSALISGGDSFRLLTGHLVHLGWPHLAMNIAGLGLIWFLVGAVFGLWQWLAVLLASAAGIDLGFWLFAPGIEWYVGLSGVLHGVLAGGVVGLWPSRRGEALILGLALLSKLAWEGLVGPMPGSEQTAGAPVITSAHLFGAVGGAMAALSIRAFSRRRVGR